jgi:putative ABC transport system substrate-binding protein
MRRRDFISIFGSAVAWPLAARAQQADAMPRVGALFGTAENDPEGRNRIDAFRQGLEKLGWTPGKNLRIEARWAGGDLERLKAQAAELVHLKPDVLLAGATTSLVALQQATRDIPIVFAQVTDPVGAGFVASLARPGGNITGFTQHEFAIGVKWLELLKELAPRVKRVAVIHQVDNPASAGYLTSSALSMRLRACRTAALSCCQVRSLGATASSRWRSSIACPLFIPFAIGSSAAG